MKTSSKKSRLFGYQLLAQIDPFFLEAGELEAARLQHEQLAQLFEGEAFGKNPRLGSFVSGTVQGVDDKQLYIKIEGLKHDAICPINEAGDLIGAANGTRAEFWVTATSELQQPIAISRAKVGAWQAVEAARSAGQTVVGRVFSLAYDRRSRRPVGLRIIFDSPEFKGIRGFVPQSEIDRSVRAEDLLDTQIELDILESDATRGGEFGYLVLSHKAVQQAKIADLIDALEPGDEVDAEVKAFFKANPNDRDESVIVDLGNGLTAMIHRSEIAGYPSVQARQALAIGQKVKAIVTRIDSERGRVSVSTKAMARKIAVDMLQVGLIVEAQVMRKVEFGAFVNIGGGIDGLVHNLDLAETTKGKRETLEIGQTIKVVVLGFEAGGQRLSLGRKQLPAEML
ncbi:MAG: S1 RNA-binding domain-containing protein [Candidatus Obscuribacterales bacterium]|nr:S1 RNA-binding domain-containing protein [Candidatus Obscuribacterales bacterium]